MVEGTSSDKSFAHQCRRYHLDLRLAIRATAPDFRPFKDTSEYRKPDEPLFQQREDSVSITTGEAFAARPTSPNSLSDSSDGEDGKAGRSLLYVRKVIKE